MGLTARGPELSGGLVAEMHSADPEVLTDLFYDWLQGTHQESALAALEGLAAEMNYRYDLAPTIGESILMYVLQYDRQAKRGEAQAVCDLLYRVTHQRLNPSELPAFYNSLGRHVLAQLSVYRARPKQYLYR